MSDIDRKRAIEILKSERDNDIFAGCGGRKHVHEALSMAIASLETDEAYQLEYESTTNQMDFPNTFDEFANEYGFKDKDEVYTNGSQLIQVFRVKQWLEHISTTKNDLGVDAVSREKAIKWAEFYTEIYDAEVANKEIMRMLREMPPVTLQEPVLEKIRAEIEYEVKVWSEPSKYNVEPVVNSIKAKEQSYKHCLEIIDKYKAESEVKDDSN